MTFVWKKTSKRFLIFDLIDQKIGFSIINFIIILVCLVQL